MKIYQVKDTATGKYLSATERGISFSTRGRIYRAPIWIYESLIRRKEQFLIYLKLIQPYYTYSSYKTFQEDMKRYEFPECLPDTYMIVIRGNEEGEEDTLLIRLKEYLKQQKLARG